MARGKSTEPTEQDEDERLEESFQCNLDEVENYYSFSDTVKDKLRELGVGNMEAPAMQAEHLEIFPGARFKEGKKGAVYFDGRLPLVITKLSIDQLSSLLSLFTVWYDYVLQQYMFAETELSEAKRQKEFMWSMVRTRLKDAAKKHGRKLSDQEASDHARIDSRFVKVDSIFIEKYVLHSCMEAMLRSAGHNLDTVSRMISARDVKVRGEARARGLSSVEGRPAARFAERYQPASARPNLPGMTKEEDSDDEGEAAEADVAPEEGGIVPSKAKRPRLRLKKS